MKNGLFSSSENLMKLVSTDFIKLHGVLIFLGMGYLFKIPVAGSLCNGVNMSCCLYTVQHFFWQFKTQNFFVFLTTYLLEEMEIFM